MKKYQLIFIGLALFVLTANSWASENGHWWFALDVGGTDLSYESPTLSDNESTFFMALRAGYEFNNRLKIGIETNGFLLESGNLWDTSKGEGISQKLLLTSEFFPIETNSWYLKLGLGWSSYWNNDQGFRQSDTGAWLVGAGYEFDLMSNLKFAPFAEYHGGKVSQLDYDGLSIGSSFIWNF